MNVNAAPASPADNEIDETILEALRELWEAWHGHLMRVVAHRASERALARVDGWADFVSAVDTLFFLGIGLRRRR